MPYSLLRNRKVVIAALINLALLVIIERSAIWQGALEMLFTGRLPMSEVYIGFEHLFGGMIFAGWIIVTYNFTIIGLGQLMLDLKPHENHLHTDTAAAEATA